jgi:hypothetical protein
VAGLFDGLVDAGQHQLRNIKAKLVVPMVDVDYVDPIAHSPLAATNSWERIDGREHRRCGGWRARTLTQIIAVAGNAGLLLSDAAGLRARDRVDGPDA